MSYRRTRHLSYSYAIGGPREQVSIIYPLTSSEPNPPLDTTATLMFSGNIAEFKKLDIPFFLRDQNDVFKVELYSQKKLIGSQTFTTAKLFKMKTGKKGRKKVMGSLQSGGVADSGNSAGSGRTISQKKAGKISVDYQLDMCSNEELAQLVQGDILAAQQEAPGSDLLSQLTANGGGAGYGGSDSSEGAPSSYSRDNDRSVAMVAYNNSDYGGAAVAPQAGFGDAAEELGDDLSDADDTARLNL